MAANAYDLTVHDILVQDITTFTRTGQVQQQKRLTFYVGDHGPFTRNYSASEATTERIKSDIDAQVLQIRELSEHQAPGV
jgi:hypothetical protein